MTHTHTMGDVDEQECSCGAIHIYCETCFARLTPCPIFDAPDALREILMLCRSDDSDLAQQIAQIASEVIDKGTAEESHTNPPKENTHGHSD